MAKEKKIGIKYFLNKKLKPIQGSAFLMYPLYVRIHFNGENTTFPIWFPSIEDYMMKSDYFGEIFFEQIGYLDEEAFGLIIEVHDVEEVRKEIKSIEKKLEKAIRFEYSILGDKFTLKGFKNRFDVYLQLFRPFAEKDLIKRLQKEIKEKQIKVPEEVLVYFHESFVQQFYLSVDKYVKGKLKNQLSKDFMDKYICFLSMAKFEEEEAKKGFAIIDWVSDLKLQKDFMDFLFKIVNERGASNYFSGLYEFPSYDFDPIVIMGVMKKWLIQV
jgi:hypothetical protein